MAALSMVLRSKDGELHGDGTQFRALLGLDDAEDLDVALVRLCGATLPDIRRLSTVRLNGPDGVLLLTIQAIPGGEILLLQRADRLLSCADPVEEQRDTLTGCLSRAAFEARLRVLATESGRSFALHLIDLDGFKGVNDSVGHAMGDRLLQVVARRLSGVIREKDVFARLGGDEFAIIQFDPELPQGADAFARRIVELAGRPYVLDGHMLDIGASVGVASCPADERADWQQMLRNADVAMYRAKEEGRRRHCFFEAGMDNALRERRQLEIELRQALAFRQFELYYQPQMKIADRSISGMEALIRWNHPTRGLLPPGVFIELAEETGIIVPIGEWVLRRACQDAMAWPDHIAVAVNVSARQLVSAKLYDAVLAALEQAGLPPHRLEIEITESVLMKDKDRCLDILHRLRAHGVRIAMDDFGTGYSSLSYLQSFPFDKLKIDRSFVKELTQPKNAEIVTAISTLGRILGMETIAEGVETDSQLAEIGAIGCNTAQGFLIACPTRTDKLAPFLSTIAHLAPADPAPALAVTPVAAVVAQEADLHRLVYYSRNAMFAYESDLATAVNGLLEVSRRNNHRVGVTGALLFNDGFFAQVLEGERAAVEETFERIQCDTRHGDIVLVAFEPCQSRRFGEWSMAHVGAEAARSLIETDATRGAFDPARFGGDDLIGHLSALLEEEHRFAPRAA